MDVASILTIARAVIRVVALEFAVIPAYDATGLARLGAAHVTAVMRTRDHALGSPMTVTDPFGVAVARPTAASKAEPSDSEEPRSYDPSPKRGAPAKGRRTTELIFPRAAKRTHVHPPPMGIAGAAGYFEMFHERLFQ